MVRTNDVNHKGICKKSECKVKFLKTINEIIISKLTEINTSVSNNLTFSVKFYPHMRNLEKYLGGLMSMNMSKEGPHLILFPISPTQFADYNHVFKGRTTRLVGYLDKQALMSANKKCSLIILLEFVL